MQPVYLDNNATTRPSAGAVRAVREVLESDWANPSSVHRSGQGARRRVEIARAQIASLLGARPREITFTGSGTESIDLAIRGALRASGKRVIVTSDLEHAAVADLVAALEKQGLIEVRRLPILPGGVVDADALPALLDESVALVSIQWANNETGVIQPVDAIGQACQSAGVLFHCDAVQAAGKLRIDVSRGVHAPDTTPTQSGFELLTISGHKFHGPKGVGVLWARPGVRVRPQLIGSQELGRRGGTEPVAAIAGAGVAAEEARAWLDDTDARARIASLRDRLEAALLDAIPGAVVNGVGSESRPTQSRLWNTTNIGFAGVSGEALLMALSERGVYASAGAACSSGSLDPSPVLLAMGVGEQIAHGSIRLSLSKNTTEGEIERAIEAIVGCVQRML